MLDLMAVVRTNTLALTLVALAGCSEKFEPPEDESSPSLETAEPQEDSHTAAGTETGTANDTANDTATDTSPHTETDTAADPGGESLSWGATGMGCFGTEQASFYTQASADVARMELTLVRTASDDWQESHDFPAGEPFDGDQWRWELLMVIVADAADQLAGTSTLFDCSDTESERFGWTLRATAMDAASTALSCHVLGHDPDHFAASGCEIYEP